MVMCVNVFARMFRYAYGRVGVCMDVCVCICARMFVCVLADTFSCHERKLKKKGRKGLINEGKRRRTV